MHLSSVLSSLLSLMAVCIQNERASWTYSYKYLRYFKILSLEGTAEVWSCFHHPR